MKQFIITHDHEIHIYYNNKNRVYELDEVKGIYLKREKKKRKYLHILTLYAIAFSSAFLSIQYPLLCIISVLSFGIIIYSTPAEPYNYYIIITVGPEENRIKIRSKDKLVILREITSFLNYHFVYKTFTAIESSKSRMVAMC